MEKPLIVGGDGSIARALAERLQGRGIAPYLTTRRKGQGLYLDSCRPA